MLILSGSHERFSGGITIGPALEPAEVEAPILPLDASIRIETQSKKKKKKLHNNSDESSLITHDITMHVQLQLNHVIGSKSPV